MMNMCAVAGLASSGICLPYASIFRSALASPWGEPAISAPVESARNSRDLEMAAWISIAASGATTMAASRPRGLPPRLSSLRPPPKIAANCAMRASIMMAAAIVAATELIRMSRFRTCASSCAMTPASSLRSRTRMMPSVAATAACCGLRPVAKALGDASGITYTLGIGSDARRASSAVSWCSGCSGPTSLARYIRRTILSENQYEPKFMTIAKPNASTRPCWPPSRSPMTSSRALSSPSSAVVFKVLPINPLCRARRVGRRTPTVV